jgi:hypothetical protein
MFGTALAALLGAQLSAAAKPAHACPACRALGSFRTCDKPFEGKQVFKARVTKVGRSTCTQVLSIEVVDAAALALPPRIEVALGPCATWGGETGAVIDMAVNAPATENRLYSLACRLW